jgi:hypothetical protein
MKTTILAAVAALSLGVGSAFAQGAPAGYQPPAYGSQGFSHSGQAATPSNKS